VLNEETIFFLAKQYSSTLWKEICNDIGGIFYVIMQ